MPRKKKIETEIESKEVESTPKEVEIESKPKEVKDNRTLAQKLNNYHRPLRRI